jgi:hypothetical protein
MHNRLDEEGAIHLLKQRVDGAPSHIMAPRLVALSALATLLSRKQDHAPDCPEEEMLRVAIQELVEVTQAWLLLGKRKPQKIWGQAEITAWVVLLISAHLAKFCAAEGWVPLKDIAKLFDPACTEEPPHPDEVFDPETPKQVIQICLLMSILTHTLISPDMVGFLKRTLGDKFFDADALMIACENLERHAQSLGEQTAKLVKAIERQANAAEGFTTGEVAEA